MVMVLVLQIVAGLLSALLSISRLSINLDGPLITCVVGYASNPLNIDDPSVAVG